MAVIEDSRVRLANGLLRQELFRVSFCLHDGEGGFLVLGL